MSNVAVVTIAGSTVTSKVRINTVRISDTLNQPKGCTFRMDTTAPSAGQELKIGLGTTTTADLIFGGIITVVAQAYEGQKANLCWDVTAQDYTFLLKRQYPLKMYVSQSATAIATDLVSSFSSGFTTTNVQSSLASCAVNYDGTSDLATCLTQLANLAGCYWYVDFGKDVHFFTAEATGNPDTLDGTGTKLQNEPPITLETDLQQVRTRVHVEGATSSVVAPVPIGVSIIPVQSTTLFNSSGGSARTGSQRVTYTGISTGGAIAAPVGTWTLTPAGGGSGSLPPNTNVSYKITYLTAAGESLPSAASSTVSTGGTISDRDVNVTFAPTAGSLPTNITGFQMYRSLLSSAGAGPWKLFNFSTVGNALIMGLAAAGGFTKDDLIQGTESIDPPTTSTAGNDEMFGSATNGSTAVAATSVVILERGHFNASGGVALVSVSGTPFIIKYTGKTGSYGGGSLTGVPASGYGSVLFTIPTGTAIQNVACLTGCSGVVYPILAGDSIVITVQRDNSSAQTALAALEGGDGIHRHVISDGSLQSDAAMIVRGDADLALYDAAIQTIRYVTRDVKTRSGKTVTVSLAAPTSISGTFKITQTTIDQVDLAAGVLAPRFTTEASTARFSLEDLLRQLSMASG